MYFKNHVQIGQFNTGKSFIFKIQINDFIPSMPRLDKFLNFTIKKI